MTPTQFRNALRHLRLGQTEMARLLGEEPRTIRRWIAGDTRIPRGTVMIIRASHNWRSEESENNEECDA